MTGLQETFYIMGIIFMSLTFLLTIALVAAVFVIRSKINKIHATLEEKVNTVADLAEKGGELSALAGAAVVKKAKKAIKNARK